MASRARNSAGKIMHGWRGNVFFIRVIAGLSPRLPGATYLAGPGKKDSLPEPLVRLCNEGSHAHR